MSIEQALHEAWAASSALGQLLPAERLLTGGQPGEPELPYGVLVRSASWPVSRTSSQTELRRTRVRWAIYAGELGTAQAIVGAIRERFERQPLTIAGEPWLNMQWVKEEERWEPPGVWRATVDYDVDTRVDTGS